MQDQTPEVETQNQQETSRNLASPASAYGNASQSGNQDIVHNDDDNFTTGEHETREGDVMIDEMPVTFDDSSSDYDYRRCKNQNKHRQAKNEANFLAIKQKSKREIVTSPPNDESSSGPDEEYKYRKHGPEQKRAVNEQKTNRKPAFLPDAENSSSEKGEDDKQNQERGKSDSFRHRQHAERQHAALCYGEHGSNPGQPTDSSEENMHSPHPHQGHDLTDGGSDVSNVSLGDLQASQHNMQCCCYLYPTFFMDTC